MFTSTPLNILLIEDERLVGQSLAKTLDNVSRAGYLVEICYSLAAAETRLAQWPFDVVIGDWCTPEAADLATLAFMQQMYPNLRTLLVAGQGALALQHQAQAQGCGYLVKPFGVEALLAVLHKTPTTCASETALLALKKGLHTLATQGCGPSSLRPPLEALRRVLGAPYVMLGGVGGRTLAASGDAALVPQPVLKALAYQSLTVASELTGALDEQTTLDLQYHSGDHYEIYAIKINAHTSLVMVFCQPAPMLEQVWGCFKQAAQMLQEVGPAELAVAAVCPPPAGNTGSLNTRLNTKPFTPPTLINFSGVAA